MASMKDYLPGGEHDPNAPAGGIDAELEAAKKDQEAREANATPTDWEERFKNLERLNSQQAQTVGEYRKVIDEYILNPTPASEPSQEPSAPITQEELYENPSEVINNAIASHPAIQRAAQIEQQFANLSRETAVNVFRESHPDYVEIKDTPEFASWVSESPTRQTLHNRANSYDMDSADALFSLYKQEKGLSKQQDEAKEADAIKAASLEESTSTPVESSEAKYSRAEFVDMKMKANQGNAAAENWINRNVAAYREALQSGNVRD